MKALMLFAALAVLSGCGQAPTEGEQVITAALKCDSDMVYVASTNGCIEDTRNPPPGQSLYAQGVHQGAADTCQLYRGGRHLCSLTEIQSAYNADLVIKDIFWVSDAAAPGSFYTFDGFQNARGAAFAATVSKPFICCKDAL